MAAQEVTIFGAGMSGLIAAIDLAKQDFKVIVHDREPGYGGSSIFNPSMHSTPLDVEATSRYLGIDISSCCVPLSACPAYFHDLKVEMPIKGVYAMERGSRPTSLDTLLYGQCQELGVEFAWESRLDEKALFKLPPRTIIACGLVPSTYRMLDIPYIQWEAWHCSGDLDIGALAWLWFDEGINEYGYFTAANGFYFDMLFSNKQKVSRDSLKKYEDFMIRNLGVEHHDWRYRIGATPAAAANNPRLYWRDAILCGTISGTFDPFLGFGISGALVSAKVAALAITDPAKAEADFKRFNRMFRQTFLFKNKVWWKYIRPQVKLMEMGLRLAGPANIAKMGNMGAEGKLPVMPFVPGFSNFGVH